MSLFYLLAQMAGAGGLVALLLDIYGQRDAGLIVKWVFYHHKGRHRGEYVTPLSFAKGSRWWVDKMYFEMQGAVNRSRPRNMIVTLTFDPASRKRMT